jgi:hypothetical protein
METTGEPTPAPPRFLKFRCPSCNRKFATKPELAGQKIRCNRCGAGVRIPWADEDSDAPAPQPVVAAYADVHHEPAPQQPIRGDVGRVDLRSSELATSVSRSAVKSQAEIEQRPPTEQPVSGDAPRVDLRSPQPSTTDSRSAVRAYTDIQQQPAPQQPVRGDAPRVDLRPPEPPTTASRFGATAQTGIAARPAVQQPVGSDAGRVDLRSTTDAKPTVASGPVVQAPERKEIAQLDDAKRRRPESVLSSRSELMEQVRQQAAEKEAIKAQRKAEKARQRKKEKGNEDETTKVRHSSFFDPKETLKLVGGVGALVAVLAFLAWGYPEFRFPLGGLLCVVGFVVYLLGSASLRQLVAEEGAFKALMFRFCPPYQWWFVATRWEETKDFVAFFLAGAFVMSMGGWIIKMSPTGAKAEASERAYQKLMNRRQAGSPPPIVVKGISNDDDD